MISSPRYPRTSVRQAERGLHPNGHRVGAILLLTFAASVQADDFIVYSPHVLATQSEIELRGFQYNDSRADFRDGSSAELSLAHAFTDWWKPEVYLLRFEKDPGASGRLVGYELENTFQFTQPGQYWVDVGLLASYEHQTVAGLTDALEFGPLLEKNVGRFDYKVNIIAERPIGSGASGKFMVRSSYSATYAISAALRPGVEAYARPDDHAYQIGPVLAGEWHLPGMPAGLEYRIGVVLGVNASAPRQTWLAQIEYEFF